jgi:hypothetical protein
MFKDGGTCTSVAKEEAGYFHLPGSRISRVNFSLKSFEALLRTREPLWFINRILIKAFPGQ